MDGEINQVDVTSQNQNVIDVIPVQIVDTYNQAYKTIEEAAQHVARTKYYKQTYRPAWEQMPDFQGWLKGVDNEPTRAFCVYCQKTLHAHRLSLLKHTCTIRHQKAAQLHQMRKNKVRNKVEDDNNLSADDDDTGDNFEHEEDDEIIQFSVTQYSKNHVDGDIEEIERENINETDQDQLEEEDDRDAGMQLVESYHSKSYSAEPVAPISTQVTDAVRGTPVSGLQVSLYKLIDGRWTYINEGFTNHSGKFSKFLEGLNFTPGRYKLHYDVDKYFELKKQNSLYPFIEIVFDLQGKNNNYHIPLILSPNSYTTYKG
ncbi:hypothetical protein WA026_012916 [Henosepilachna vigintioctopunctata]|uniref:hydroxyisourate hydrolase n=1 Tax=Henosepilachna vigintioctopunctata TaxID=420089 RepID=A0AAW1TK50_9CUCU